MLASFVQANSVGQKNWRGEKIGYARPAFFIAGASIAPWDRRNCKDEPIYASDVIRGQNLEAEVGQFLEVEAKDKAMNKKYQMIIDSIHYR